VRSKFLWNGVCNERLGIHNFDPETHTIELSFQFAADFADIFEVRGHERNRRGETKVSVSGDGVTYAYYGLDDVVRRTVIRFEPEPEHVDADGARLRLEIPPGGNTSAFFTISCLDEWPEPMPPRRFFVCLREAQRALRASTARAASVETS